jgi:hypothetical protein
MTRALERGELPAAGFRHVDHLRVACVYLDESPGVDEALRRMAQTLKRVAASVGRAEKYSDAVTAFWMYQLAAVRAVVPGADADALVRAFPRLLDKNLLRPDDGTATGSADSSRDAPHRPVSRGPA